MALHQLQLIEQNLPSYPHLLIKRLGKDAAARLWIIGSSDLLDLPKTAFFCSNKCPGDAILAAMDQARKWRDEGRCIISGFHSPIEKECLQILLRGTQPIVICPARSLERMRIPVEWRQGIETGRILLLSAFEPSQRRITSALSQQRNKLVATLAEEVYFAHVTLRGKTSRLAEQISEWGISTIRAKEGAALDI
jgi:predicted Rossmann fold nucleotide-binding protein DprA/Smf involved in DNA uptake